MDDFANLRYAPREETEAQLHTVKYKSMSLTTTRPHAQFSRPQRFAVRSGAGRCAKKEDPGAKHGRFVVIAMEVYA
jgi:hypothetical protein